MYGKLIYFISYFHPFQFASFLLNPFYAYIILVMLTLLYNHCLSKILTYQMALPYIMKYSAIYRKYKRNKIEIQ